MTEIEKRLEGYRRLIDIARDLASTLELDILLNRIIRAAVDITGAQAASILLYDDASRQLHFQVATDMDQPLMRGLVVPLEGSIAGWIVTNRQPVRISNAQEDPRHFGMIEKVTHYATNSLLGVPLTTKEKVIGVLEALNKQSGEFSETDEDLLSVLGAQATVAIENARLFQQSDLIADFVHELRTPLAAITTATYLLLRPEMSHEQREQIVHNIHDETQRLNALASSFLDLARLESGRVQFRSSQFDLRALLEECRGVMQGKADEDGIQINIEIPADFPSLEADRDKLKQLMLNLLSNAIKYNHPNGLVTLSASLEEREVFLAVQDTGIGIPEKALPNLFQKFYRVQDAEGKPTGTGLGLSICKQIVQGHGGYIEVHSQLAEGTTFTIHLPRKK
jgi:signal transduction histidine kinase